MKKRNLSKIASLIFSDFIDGIDKNEIETSLNSKESKLNKVNLKKDLFLANRIPLEIKNGFIEEINFNFPNKNGFEDSKINGNGVFILAKFQNDFSTENRMNNMGILRKILDCTKETISKSILFSIFKNLDIILTKIFIRIEIDSEDDKYALGINIEKLSMLKQPEKTKENITKSVLIEGFSVYFENDSVSLDSVTEEELKQKFINDEHEFIIRKEVIDGNFVHSFETKRNEISLHSFDGKMKITEVQKNIFSIIRNLFTGKVTDDTFNDEKDLEESWIFVDKAAKEKFLNVEDALIFLENRNEDLEPEFFDGNVQTMIREYRRNKEEKLKTDEFINETEIGKQKKQFLDMIWENEKEIGDELSFAFELDNFTLDVSNENEKTIFVPNLKFKYNKTYENSVIKAEFFNPSLKVQIGKIEDNKTNAKLEADFLGFNFTNYNAEFSGSVDIETFTANFGDSLSIRPISTHFTINKDKGVPKIIGSIPEVHFDYNCIDYFVTANFIDALCTKKFKFDKYITINEIIWDFKVNDELKLQGKINDIVIKNSKRSSVLTVNKIALKQMLCGNSSIIEAGRTKLRFAGQVLIKVKEELHLYVSDKISQALVHLLKPEEKIFEFLNKQPLLFRIETNSTILHLNEEEMSIGTLEMQSSTLNISFENETEITLDAIKPKLVFGTEKVITFESNSAVRFHKVNNSFDSFCNSIDIDINQESFKLLKEFVLNLVPRIERPKDWPKILPIYKYNFVFDEIHAKGCGKDGSTINTDITKFTFQTEIDERTFHIVFNELIIKNEANKIIASIEGNNSTYVFVQCSQNIPAVIPGVNDFDIESYRIDGAYYINEVKTTVSLDKIKFEMKESNSKDLINVIQTLYNPNYEPTKIFPIVKSLNIDVSFVEITVPKFCSINLAGFSYGNINGHFITTEKLSISAYEKIEGVPDPLLTCDTEGLTAISFELTQNLALVTINGLCAFYDYNFLKNLTKVISSSSLFNTVWKKSKEDINFSAIKTYFTEKDFKISLNKAYIKVPVSLESDGILTFIGSFIVNKSQDITCFDCVDLSTAFIKEANAIMQSSICDNFSFQVRFGTDIEVYLNCQEINLTASDIAAYYTLMESIRKVYYKLFVSNKEEVEGVDLINLLNLNRDFIFRVNMLKVQMCFSETTENDGLQTPLVRFWVKPFEFRYNFLSKEKSETILSIEKCEVFNIPIHQWDTVLDPLSITFNFMPSTNHVDVIVDDPVNTSISFITTKQLISFVKDVKRRIEHHDYVTVKKIPLDIVNNTAEEILFSIPGKDNFTMQTNESRTMFVPNNTEIRTSHGGRVWEISMKSLFYPIYMRRKVVCYKINNINSRKIIFSSTFIITNHTPYPLLLSKNDGEIITIFNPEQVVPLPYDISLDDSFCISDSENTKSKNAPAFTLSSLKSGPHPIKVPVGSHQLQMILHKSKKNKYHVRNISIYCSTVVVSEVPENICISLGKSNEELTLVPFQETQLCINTAKTNQLYAWIERDSNKETCTKPAKITNKETTTSVTITSLSLCTIIDLAVTVTIDETGVQKITIFAPLIVKNVSGFGFFLTDATHSKRIAMEKKGRYYQMYWSDPDFFNEPDKRSLKVIPFAIDQNITSDKPIECIGLDDSMFYLVPLNAEMTQSLPLRYNISSYFHSRIITFYPALKICNMLPYDITIVPKFKSKDYFSETVFESGTTNTLSISDNHWTYLISSSIASVNTELVLQSPTNTAFLLFKKLGYDCVDLSVTPIGETMLVTFKIAVAPHNIMISNETDTVIFASQVGFEPVQIYDPETTKIFAYNQPYQQTGIQIISLSESIIVYPDNINTSLHFGKYFVEVTVSKEGPKIIRITNEPIIHTLSIPFSVRISISSLSYSIIDEKIKEAALLIINGIQIIANNKETGPELTLTIHQIELDDLHPAAPYEVAALCRSEDRVSDFFVACLFMKPNTPLFTAFRAIGIQTGITELYLDLSFVSDFLQLISSTLPHKSDEKDSETEISSWDRKTVSCEHLMVNESVFDVSIERKTSRKKEYPPISSLLTFIPSASQSRISLDGLELYNFEATPTFIKKNIISPLISEAKLKAAKIFLNVDVLFNIGGITDNIIRGCNDPSRSAFDITAGTALRVGENIFVAASRIVHGITDNFVSANKIGLNMTAKETALTGIKSLGTSIIDSGAGIFMDPLRGMQKEGFIGFVKGVGKGVTGIVARPVIGLVDATSGLIIASRKAVENNIDVHKRVRQSRATIFGVVKPYNQLTANMQSMIRLRDVGNGSLNETVEIIFGKPTMKAITQKSIYFFNEKVEIVDVVPICTITNCNLYEKEIEIIITNDKVITFSTDSEKVSQLIYSFIRSSSCPETVSWL